MREMVRHLTVIAVEKEGLYVNEQLAEEREVLAVQLLRAVSTRCVPRDNPARSAEHPPSPSHRRPPK